MNRDDFTAALEQELRLRGVPFDLAELLAFAEDVWPLADDPADIGRWATAFLEARAGVAAAPGPGRERSRS
jgi:hypothetical protein